MGMFYRIIRLLENGIKPVYVFDGKPTISKSGELSKRAERREDTQKALEKATEAGNEADMDKFNRRLIKEEDEEMENKEKNGSIDNEKKVTDDKEKKESGKEAKEGEEEVDDDENVVALAEIDKINENINKTRVDGLQTLHTICFGS
uniref:XPG N-terminal domain-containing protein n=1 Tax=Glossina palpalis gambiensis TaxID=67801 RepID=A0A1B0B7E6_9MUSC